MMSPSTEYLYNDSRSLHEQRFRRLRTLKPACVHLFLNIIFLSLVIGICMGINFLSPWNDLSLLLFSQAIFWTITLPFHYIYTCEHWFLKIRGHFKFYKSLKNYTHFMVLAPSFFCVLLLIVQAVKNKYRFIDHKYLELEYYITGSILAFESTISLLTLIAYIFSVRKFNVSKPVPDTEQHDYILLADPSSSTEIGYRLDGEALHDLLEKQADLIYYLKSAIDEMNSKLMNRS